MAMVPLMASADSLNANVATGVRISPSGIVRVIGADVTAVGNGVVNAVTTFGNVVMSWIVNISATTKVSASGTTSASTTDIKVGDKVSFSGSIASSTGSALTVAASKIRDLVSFPFRHIGTGTVSGINSTNGSFVLTSGNHSVVVQTNASTTISVNGATTTFASLQAGERVSVAGTPNANGSVITASKVVVRDSSAQRTEKNEGQKGDTDSNDDRGKGDEHASAGADRGASANVSAHSEGTHGGLNFFSGLHLGIGKDN
jgi:hypothetical protein